jgi:hypothetical protein
MLRGLADNQSGRSTPKTVSANPSCQTNETKHDEWLYDFVTTGQYLINRSFPYAWDPNPLQAVLSASTIPYLGQTSCHTLAVPSVESSAAGTLAYAQGEHHDDGGKAP